MDKRRGFGWLRSCQEQGRNAVAYKRRLFGARRTRDWVRGLGRRCSYAAPLLAIGFLGTSHPQHARLHTLTGLLVVDDSRISQKQVSRLLLVCKEGGLICRTTQLTAYDALSCGTTGSDFAILCVQLGYSSPLRACRYDMHIGISILRFIIYGRFDTIGRGARGVVPYDATCTKAISSA